MSSNGKHPPLRRDDRLRQLISELESSNDHLRKVLVRQKRALVTARRFENGDMTAATVLDGGAPEMRVELTDAMSSFERARHRVRVALVALLGQDHETSTAEIGRSLGISRQLASRLAQEAELANF